MAFSKLHSALSQNDSSQGVVLNVRGVVVRSVGKARRSVAMPRDPAAP